MNAGDSTAGPEGGQVQRSDQDGIATLTLSRPAQFNALSFAMIGELEQALLAVADDPSVRVVVLAGAGRAFCPGHDLKELLSHRTSEFVEAVFERFAQVTLTMQRLPQPVIACVHGVATAAGCQLVAASDLAVAAEDARFATSGIRFGLFCATPAVPLSRNIGQKRAFQMLLTGEFIDARTAREWGLVNSVVAPDLLQAETLSLARQIIEKPRAVVEAGKRFFYEQLELPVSGAYPAAARAIAANMLGPDAEEGVTAFVEKRAPRWP